MRFSKQATHALFILIFLCAKALAVSAQDFTATGAAIPDDGNSITFEMEVSGLPDMLDSVFGLEQVCLNIDHTWNSDLSLTLVAPDGSSTILFSGIGGDTDGFLNTCLNCNAAESIYQGGHPYTGSYKPLGDLGVINNGQNPNGIWKLIILDTYAFADAGTLNNWTISFGAEACTIFRFESSNLPIVRLFTEGLPIPDEPKIDAIMEVVDNGPGVRNLVAQTATYYTGPVGIETHGNSTQGFPKKSFRIETRDILGQDTAVALMKLPPTSDFVLAANFSDKTLMRNALSYQLSRDIGQYASRTRFCEVFLNQVYQGIYILTERIKRGDERLDIAKLDSTEISGIDMTGGYIIKVDWNTTPGWNSNFAQPNNPGNYTYFQYEYPRWDRIAPEQAVYIRKYVDSFEVALKTASFQNPTTGWRHFADEKSFIDFLLVNEMSKNVDGYRLSTYFHKDKAGKIKMGPVWDFDLGWLNADYCDAFITSGWAYNLNYVCSDAGVPFWWERLMSDSRFKQGVACRWRSLRADVLHTDRLHNVVDSMALVLSESSERNFTQWPILGTYVWPNPGNLPATYSGEVDKLKGWITERLTWMDTELAGFEPNINALFTATTDSTGAWLFKPFSPNSNYLYHWDFGDGTQADGPDGTHNYASNGTYTVTLTVSTVYGCSETTVKTITHTTTGVAHPVFTNWAFYPNPAKDYLEIQLPEQVSGILQVLVLNALGQVVLDQEIVSGNSLDIRALPAGQYAVIARQEAAQWIGKVVK